MSLVKIFEIINYILIKLHVPDLAMLIPTDFCNLCYRLCTYMYMYMKFMGKKIKMTPRWNLKVSNLLVVIILPHKGYLPLTHCHVHEQVHVKNHRKLSQLKKVFS